MRKLITLLLLVGLATAVVAAERAVLPAETEDIPGLHLFQYDDGLRYQKLAFNTAGRGWGVLYGLCEDCCFWLKEVHTNLCPPPLDGPYQATVKIYDDDGPFRTPGTLLHQQDFDVLEGCWWHYIFLTSPVQVYGKFYVFVVGKTYPTQIYQWFDQFDNAPPGTQWYTDGTNFSPYTSVGFGDVEIRVVAEIHDVGATAVESPTAWVNVGDLLTPKAWVRNGTTWPEPGTPVKFWIDKVGGARVYEQTKLVNFPGNLTPFPVEFPSVVVTWEPGLYEACCSTMLYCDGVRYNDMVCCEFWVQLLDVGCVSIDAPKGNIARGVPVIPKSTVENFGTLPAAFKVKFRITDATDAEVYSDEKWVPTLMPGGAGIPVSFASWTPTVNGQYYTSSKTELVGDANPTNDQCCCCFRVWDNLIDAGVTTILSPTGTIKKAKKYPLKVRVQNFGTGVASFPVKCSLVNPFGVVKEYSKAVAGLASGGTADVQFAKRKYGKLGTWSVKSWTELFGDMNAWNDKAVGSFIVKKNVGWLGIDETPAGAQIDKGAGLASDGDGTYYLLTGKRSPELYVFAEETDMAQSVGMVPEGERKLGYGTALAYLEGKLYLLKGNKSSEFYVLDLTTQEWTRLADLPGDRAPSKGASMTAVAGKLYVLKGNKTNEFYCYDPASNGWEAMASIPGGCVNDGGALCNNGTRVFALKGNKTVEFYTYDVGTNGWQQLADVPTRRVKDGAALSCVDGVVFATVGGGKMEFYAYDALINEWTRLEDVLRGGEADRQKVKSGAAMANLDGLVVLLKGKKSTVILGYEPAEELFGSGRDMQSGVMGALAEVTAGVTVAPNPAMDRIRVSYAVTGGGPANARLYNSSGQLVRALALRSGAELDVTGLANGVYLLRLVAGEETFSERFVIQH